MRNASSVLPVSISDSPFCTDEVAADTDIVRAPSILAAVSVAVIFLLLRAMRFDAVREGRLPSAPFFRSAAGAIPLSRDILLLGTVAVGVAATLFSLVWGYL